MNKIVLLSALGFFFGAQAQFKIAIETPAEFAPKEAYVYTLDGSKDILNSKVNRSGNNWNISISKPYSGMMKVFFPETNASFNLISENKDIKVKLLTNKEKITRIDFLDEPNALMSSIQDNQQKKELILPALYQIKEYYKSESNFGKALDTEILTLSDPTPDVPKYPFVHFYNDNYNRFVEKSASKTPATEKEIQEFLVNSNELLEASSLMRPVLVSYLNLASAGSNVSGSVDTLLNAVNTETPRGQTVMSELIDIFDVYGMNDLKTKYLTDAKNLKCTINDRLTSTIKSNTNVEMGAKFPNYKFANATNTTAKSIHEVKAKNKILVFWSSTCSHCEKELPEILEKYNDLKKLNVEVIGLSLDSDKTSYINRISSLPWINDSELKGWYSSYVETYNVHATPTYFVLDADNKIVAKPDHAKDALNHFNLK